jgi:biopolymer transport protein ExbB
LLCIIAGYVIWRYIIGANGNFTHPDPEGGFWPNQEGPKVVFPVCIWVVLSFLSC